MWLWCLHCERAYRADEARRVGGVRMCAYADCDGSLFLDGWPWKRVRQLRGYPDVPEQGKRYPLYGN